MEVCMAMLDPAHGIAGSTLVTAMARNGTDFGIRVSGLGNRWFVAPAEIPVGLFFPGFSQQDANPDIGDSTITETAGIGAFALRRVRVPDLSQNFSVNSPPFAFYEGPTIKWVKKLAFEGVNAQLISSTNHIATHLDSPLHFHDPGPDRGSIPISQLVGPACIVDP